MVNQTIDHKLSLSNLKAQLKIIEAIAKTAAPPMQQILAIDLQAFTKRLQSWATAAPMHKFIYTYENHYKQPQKGGDTHARKGRT